MRKPVREDSKKGPDNNHGEEKFWTNIQSPFKPPTYDALTLTGDIIPSVSHLRDAIRMSDNSHDIIQRK